jgi:hypothetical protein
MPLYLAWSNTQDCFSMYLFPTVWEILWPIIIVQSEAFFEIQILHINSNQLFLAYPIDNLPSCPNIYN